MKTMRIPDFMQHGWQEDRVIDTVIAHCRKHKLAYQVIGFTLIVYTGLTDVAFAGTGIDEQAKKIFEKILNIGKWIIIVKGAVDTLQLVTQGDMQSAKKNFLGYTLTYLILHALPWTFDQIDMLFSEIKSS